MQCVSCERDVMTIEGSVIFKCPKCGETIVRCGICRKRGVKYTCPNCGFTGP